MSALLSLPLHIKKKIYFYAVCQTVHLTPKDPLLHLPPLTIASRQILKETLPVFLKYTVFVLHVHDCDGAFTINFHRQLDGIYKILDLFNIKLTAIPGSGPPIQATSLMSGRPHFKNALRWAIAVHQYRGEPVAFGPPSATSRPDADVLNSMLRLAQMARFVPWYQVHQYLKKIQTAAVAKNREWA